ncbi:MAG: chromosome segregation protein SMC [Acutalibacteraceae bacterium]
MLLKSLEIQGFKTFPDKTKLSFDKGITAVVGPNGSGKSNISDAIRWVLGEQSPKALRCSKMEDVVFNGTDQRKKQGYAEVTLTIDNKDRALEFDGDEIAVTRRYYRSGDSEYLINRASVRLKDIHELFMDTGLGRDGYSMIGQGKIDSIVASKSEDRREIFEEAAGISRYRYRKIEAERKLKSAEENLLRLRDIVSELEERVEPLRKQSEKATAFLEYSSEKKEIEIALWLDTLEKSAGVLRDHEEKIEIARSQNEAAADELDKISAQTEEYYLKGGEYSGKIEQVRNEISFLEEKSAEKRSFISVAENNIFHNNENIKRIEGEISTLDSSFTNLGKDIENKKSQIAEKNQTLESLKKEHDTLTQRLGEINLVTGENSQLMQQLSFSLTKLTAEAADIKVKQMTSASSVAENNERINRLNDEIAELNKTIEDLSAMLDDYKRREKEYADKLISLNNSCSGLKLRIESKKNRAESDKKLADKLVLDTLENRRRIKLLEDLEKNLEGFNHSVKIVMKESERGTLSGIHGPVSRVIQVPKEYTVAIETALGAAMQNIVTGTENDAKSAINMLKKRDGGRCTFLPMTTIKGKSLNESGLDRCEGFIGIAQTLCSCAPEYSGILSSLLGRIVIAEDLNCAVKIAKQHSYRFKVVTLDGQVVNAGGSLTGGSLARKSGLLSRVSEIESLKQHDIELTKMQDEATKKYNQTVSDIQKDEAEITVFQDSLAKLKEQQIRLEAEAAACKNEYDGEVTALAEYEAELKTRTSKAKTLLVDANSATQELEKINKQISEIEEKSKEIAGTGEEYSRQREEISEQLQDLNLKRVSLDKDIEALNAEINLALSTGNTQEVRKKSLIADIELYKEKNISIQQQIDELTSEIEQFTADIKAKNEKITSLNQERMNLEKASADLRRLEKEKINEKELSGRELARLEERKMNLQKQYDDIISKLWEEYELTRREAEQTVKPLEDVATARKRLNELKNKIKALGSVNVGAIEEYKEVSERYEFLSAQVSDVEKSRSEILRLINDLTKQMQELFVERFEKINEHFKATFKELFGGGDAFLELSNPDDILQSGIDINVHPPGKIVMHLESLSGGEKALVAIALYFAIMKVSPAPFCVMDEIEAALDDVNVYRFASYLRNMNDRTQFILITHRRGTMEEADVLYGVTMQDKGVSKLLEMHSTEISQAAGVK